MHALRVVDTGCGSLPAKAIFSASNDVIPKGLSVTGDNPNTFVSQVSDCRISQDCIDLLRNCRESSILLNLM